MQQAGRTARPESARQKASRVWYGRCSSTRPTINLKEETMTTRRKNLPAGPLAAGIAALALRLVAVPARASHPGQQTLTPTDTDQDARGRAQLVLRTDEDGKFDVIAKKLDPDQTFDVIVNGVKVGTLTTTGGGSGRARFRSRPRSGDDQLLGFDPRGVA